MAIIRLDENGIFINGKLWNMVGGGGGSNLEFVKMELGGDGETIDFDNGKYYLIDGESDVDFRLPDNPNDGDTIAVLNNSGHFKGNFVNVKADKDINYKNEDYKLQLDATTYRFQFDEVGNSWIATILETKDISKMLGGFLCEPPILYNLSDSSVNERGYVEVDISNYDEETTYVVKDNMGISYSIKYKNDKTFQVFFGGVEEDTEVNFSVSARKEGFISSPSSNEMTVTVIDNSEVSDDAIVNSLMSDNEDSSNDCDVSNDIVTLKSDDGEYKEALTQQGDDEKDWTSYQTRIDVKMDKFILIPDETDNEDVLGYVDDGANYKVEAKSKVYVKGEDEEEMTLTEFDLDTTNDDATCGVLDIFEDGSCIELWTFGTDEKALNGHDLTLHGDCNFDYKGYFKNGITFWDNDDADPSAGYVTCAEMTEVKSAFTYSCFFSSKNGNSNDDTYMYICNKDKIYGIIINYDADSASNTIGVDFAGDYKRLDIPDDNTILPEDECFIALYWDKTKDDGVPHIYINNFTQDYHYTIDYDDLALTDDMDEGFTRIVGIDDTTGTRIRATVEHLRIFNRTLTSDELDTLKTEEYNKYKLTLEDSGHGKIDLVFLEDEYIEVQTALTNNEEINDDDFHKETFTNFSIDQEKCLKSINYDKVSDYKGSKFQRKVTGNKEANFVYLRSNMWKED